ncbi:glycosyl transferase [Aureococcus anophagefferens]|nr:glycosyl transferase [Aureococcus anophagefferens]
MSSFKDFVKARKAAAAKGGGAADKTPAPAPRRPPAAAPPQVAPQPPARPPYAGPRVLMVTTANLFVYDNSGRSSDMTKRPTGGLTLTYALTRYAKRALAARVVAVDFVFKHYEREARRWEGLDVDCVRLGCDPQIAAGAYDVVVVSSPELGVARWVSAHCDAPLKIAMCHDYAGAPWGPFTNTDEDQREELYAVLAGWRLLTDSQHVADYHNRFAPEAYAARGLPNPPTARQCYGACYGYYERHRMPHFADAIEREYVTIISPCAPKGLSMIAALSPMMPTTKFLCVATAWTNGVVQHILKRFENVDIQMGTQNVDDFYAQTKVLIVPSIWPEAFGLVTMEASARGIPVLLRDTTLDDMMERPRPPPPDDVVAAGGDAEKRQEKVSKHLLRCLLHIAPQDVALPFANLIHALMTDDAFYAAAAADARKSGLAFIEKHEDKMDAIIAEDFANPAVFKF